MTESFNLVDRKWIPCVHFDGSMEEFSLSEVFNQAHKLRGIQGDSPLETAALYRLLLAVLHSALRGPKNKTEWAELWANGEGNWENPWLQEYLRAWKYRFDLFDPTRPFMQKTDDRAKQKSVITLVMDMASGNNASLFDHHIEEVGVALSSAKAARTLITAQTFGLAGLWLPGITFTDSPWGRGIIYFVEGDNLFKILTLNLIDYPNEKHNCMLSSPEDKPAWEQDDPFQPVRQIPYGYLDYLSWQSRRIKLLPESDPSNPFVREMTTAPGLRLDPTIHDPMKLYLKSKDDGYYCARFSEDRALWRDSASLFGLQSKKGSIPPQSFYWLANLAADDLILQQQRLLYMALGMANDQAKVDFFRQQHFPLPLEYLNQEDLVEQLANALDLAEKVRFSLRTASQWLALLVTSPKADGKKWQEIDKVSKDEAEKLAVHWNPERFFWQQLEIPFTELLRDLPGNSQVMQNWIEKLEQTACNALESVVNLVGTDGIALKATVRARTKLMFSLRELIPEPTKEVIE